MSQFNSVKDSGARQEFNTGSVRDTRDGKGRYDLLSPIVMQRDALHMEHGAKKYQDRNWEKGQPLSRYIDSALRHTFKLLQGFVDEDHAAAARWNLAAFIHTQEMIRRGKLPKELDDMPNFGEEPQQPNYKEDIQMSNQITAKELWASPLLDRQKDKSVIVPGTLQRAYDEMMAARVSAPRTLP